MTTLNPCTYRLRHVATGTYYVGRTSYPLRRKATHLRELRKGRHHSSQLQALVGVPAEVEADFVFEAMQYFATTEETLTAETRLLAETKNDPLCVNILLTATCGDVLTRHPDRDAIIARRSKSQREANARMSLEHRNASYGRKGAKNGMFGKRHSESVKAGISELNRGNKYAKGAKRSEAFKRRLSVIASQRIGEKNPFFGRSHSAETKQKLADKQRGKLPTNTRAVVIEGVVFVSATAAAKFLGVALATIGNRIAAGRQGYAYCE